MVRHGGYLGWRHVHGNLRRRLPHLLVHLLAARRAVDDSGNLDIPGDQVSVAVSARTCPCSIWGDSFTPSAPSANDSSAVEVGVKFRADEDGYITGLRFYKGSGNTGTHVGHLWSASGTLLAEATFTGETASGWQEAHLRHRSPITAGTTYVASYHAPAGHYAAEPELLRRTLRQPAPARARGRRGRRQRRLQVRPLAEASRTKRFNAANYWVDVVFATEAGPDTTPPTITARSPASGATGVPTGADVTATFSEAMDPATISGTTVQLRNSSNTLVPGNGDLQQQLAPGEPASRQPAAELDHLYRHGQRRVRRRHGPGGEPTRVQLDLVVHHRAHRRRPRPTKAPAARSS